MIYTGTTRAIAINGDYHMILLSSAARASSPLESSRSARVPRFSIRLGSFFARLFERENQFHAFEMNGVGGHFRTCGSPGGAICYTKYVNNVYIGEQFERVSLPDSECWPMASPSFHGKPCAYPALVGMGAGRP